MYAALENISCVSICWKKYGYIPGSGLTGNSKRRVPALGLPESVDSFAPVHPRVGLLPAVGHAQEEQSAGGQQDAMGARVLRRRAQGRAVLVPRDRGLGLARRLAVERGRLVSGHHRVDGVLGDAGRLVARVMVA